MIKYYNNPFKAVADVHPEGDDIFLLRYILSFKGYNENSEEALRTAIKWRKDNAEIIKKLKEGGNPPKNDIIKKYMVIFHTYYDLLFLIYI